ncbi:hypothetical protein AAEX37_00467 [Oligella sp. MSHR50489EDL]|uniref:copper chaperone PCu(A)C n=1 Tax=Oligella sp. MSHR50489EDL TaxID=3139409 RepID=UPI003D8162EE
MLKVNKPILTTAATAMFAFSAYAVAHSHDHGHAHMHGGGAHEQVEFSGKEAVLESVEISRCWVRLVPDRPSAAYFDIKNTGTEAITLIAARAAHFHDVMLHQTVIKDGSSMMMHLEKLAIEPGQTAVFKPKDNHVMLTADSADVVKVGDKINLEFKFEGEQVAGTECLVKPINAISFE